MGLITNTLIRLALPVIQPLILAHEHLGRVLLALVVGEEVEGPRARVAPFDAHVVRLGRELDAVPAGGEFGLGGRRDEGLERAGGFAEATDFGEPAGPFVTARVEGVVGGRGGGEGDGGGEGAQREEEEGGGLHGVCLMVFGSFFWESNSLLGVFCKMMWMLIDDWRI